RRRSCQVCSGRRRVQGAGPRDRHQFDPVPLAAGPRNLPSAPRPRCDRPGLAIAWCPAMSFAKSPDSYSALPLGSIPAYAFDTETTGLDVTRDRVIEVGAMRLQSGGMADDDTFAALVNPGIPIPETTSKMHGIKDADVVNARGFSDVIGEFARWAGPAVMLGYSLGFDLAVLKSEHERCGLPWQPPRSLCVRQLAAILQPRLPDNSLEIIAGWLDIEVVGRHRALGDAKLT